MPKKLANNLNQQITHLIAKTPGGISIDTLHTHLADLLSRRTLQRRLSELAEINVIRTVGKGPSLRYYPCSKGGIEIREATVRPYATHTEKTLTLSAESEEIRRYVQQSRQLKKPVSYDPSFLAQYTPNQTAYLPESIRAQLHQIGRPTAIETEHAPAGTFARDILSRLLIDLSWASSQLEGNTYSLLDTERLIQHGQAADGKDATETQMILNHKAAIEYLVCNSENIGLNTETIIALHALLSDGLMADPLSCGRLRRIPVGIGGSVYLPISLPQRIEELFGVVIEMASEIHDPFEQSFFLMVHLPYLQPFEDVNKRVSRLAANIPFIQHNLAPLSFLDVSSKDYVEGLLGVYELNRVELLRDVFVRAYERSCQQYLAVRREMVPPDAVRLRYRHQLTTLMAAIVRQGAMPQFELIRAMTPDNIAIQDRERFISIAHEEFRSLHAGNAIRFGIRPLEFETWQAKTGR